jgi:hypothetical protein
MKYALTAVAVVTGVGVTVAVGSFLADAREARMKKASVANLEKIGAALHDFHDTYKRLPPPAILGEDGRPLLSWRVAILPHLGHKALYAQFKLDEPWDGPHNKTLLPLMPQVYAPVRSGKAGPHETFYRAFTGPGTGWQSIPAPGNPLRAHGLRLTQLPHGPGTLMLVEAGDAVPWTKPEELVYDPGKPLPNLGGLFEDGYHIMLAEALAQFVTPADEPRVRAIVTRTPGSPILLGGVP